ncbi:MAG: DUF5615 family PIN-like protein [Chloroflexi bacterium]|nr:DUF5615 family PIN-like protein [Chloroflexota bacterium]
MLRLLLDEHISHVIADTLARRRPEISITTVQQWRGGQLSGMPDDVVLLAAAEDRLTLVSSDVNTIPAIVREMGALGQAHAGVILVRRDLTHTNNFGRLVRALELFWDQECHADWTERIDFLRVPSHY